MGTYHSYIVKPVRTAAILTTSYVAGTIIDGITNQNQLILNVDFTKGSATSAEIKVEFAIGRKWTLTYDGQTSNFTVGSILRNKTQDGTAIIVADTDGGTSGTLTLVSFDENGDFDDNDIIVDEDGGYAVASADIADATDWYQEVSSSVSGGTSTDTLLEHTITASGKYRLAVPLKDAYIRVSAKGTGTMTGSSMAIKAEIGVV